ncbi:kinase-like domain-containing protein [Phyllosticta paracitricarpa]
MVFAFDPHDKHLPQVAGADPLTHPMQHAVNAAPPAAETDVNMTDASTTIVDHAARLARNLDRSTPISVASQSPHRQLQPGRDVRHAEALGEKLNFEVVRNNAAKKKKKKRAAKAAAAPAVQTIRGFQTPATSEAEETDVSAANTPAFGPVVRDIPSVTSSPALRPTSSSGGISSMRAQLDKLDLGPPNPTSSATGASSSVSVASEMSSTSERTEMETYDVDIVEDFTSSQAGDGQSGDADARLSSLSRKMTSEDFQNLTCLGKGSYGTVHLVKHKATGRLFAQKQLKKARLTVTKKLVQQTKTERAILENVNRHPFVVKLFYAFQDHEKLYLILEYAQGGELFHHLAMERMFTEEVAAFYMAEMILALDHLHRDVGVVYRDLKPENCLLDAEGHLLLTDFGLSKVAVDENDKCNSMLGTAEYMAPEVIQGKEYSFAVDWWALGALGCDLLTGSPPFTANNYTKTQEKIVKQKLQLPYFLSPDAKDLLTRLLRKEPNKRLGSNMPKDFLTIKSHRFFRRIDWKKLEKRELDPPIKPLITDPELAENFSTEFTDLPLSPVASFKDSSCFENGSADAKPNPFGGFSFIVVEKLTKNVNEEHLREIFSKYGHIQDLDMPINRSFMTNRGTAYIMFDTTESAESAIAHMHEAQLDGAVINVSIVLPRRRFSRSPPPSRRPPPPPMFNDRPQDRYNDRFNDHPRNYGPPPPRGGWRGGPPPPSYQSNSRFRSPPPYRRARSPLPPPSRGYGGPSSGPRGRGSVGGPHGEYSYRPRSYSRSRSRSRSPRRSRSRSYSSRSPSRTPPTSSRRGRGGGGGGGGAGSFRGSPGPGYPPPSRGSGGGGSARRRRSPSYSSYSSNSRSRSRSPRGRGRR